MLRLNKDVLFLIFEELQYDRNSLYSCLLVNKTWCEIIVPILWKNPWKHIKKVKEKSQFNVIISHLSNETKENLRNQGIDLIIQQKPLFNYILFCRYLELNKLEERIKNLETSKIFIIRNEILKLFINKYTKFTHLYISKQFHYQINLAELCFSELRFIYCNTESTDQNILEGLSKISKSIKKLEFDIAQSNYNFEIVKLIEVQKNLNDVHFICFRDTKDESFCQTLEESLIKHADTIQYLRMDWKPITNIFSSLINLVSLEMNPFPGTNWSHLENVSLPLLKILRAQWVPSKILANLIENTKGHLNEIRIYYEGVDNKKLIQTIYQNCSNLKYLKLLFRNRDISELKNLLINCQNLIGLIIIIDILDELNWDNLFKILTESSPISLFKFKFYSIRKLKLESLKLFFDNWKVRYPMLLQTIPMNTNTNIKDYFDLIENYKAKGIVKKYDNDLYGCTFDDFEWIQKKREKR